MPEIKPTNGFAASGENRALAAACNRLVVVDRIVDHGIISVVATLGFDPAAIGSASWAAW